MPKLVLAWVVFAVLGGCAGKTRVVRAGEEWLERIRIEGNRALDRDDLVPGLSLYRTQQGRRAIDPYQLSLDIDRIRAAYVRQGFFDVSVTARVETRIAEQRTGDTTAQTVVFTVTEGPRSRLAVVIRGLPPELDEASARALIALPDGAPFVYEAFDAAKTPMLTLVEDAGYPQVQIDAAVLADRATGIATARFDVVPGARATIGAIEIEGADGALAEAIRGRLTFSTGDLYSARALAESQRDVFLLGRFSTVRIEPDRDAGDRVPIQVSVVRARLRELKLGGGGGFDDATWQVRTRLAITYVLERLPLWKLGVDLRPALARFQGDWQPRLRARGTLERLEFLRPRLRLELDGSVDYLAYEAFTVAGPQVRAGLSSPFPGVPWLIGRVSWVFDLLAFRDIKILDPVPAELGLDRTQRRGAYELSLEIEGRDNQLAPSRGVYASFRAAVGTPYAGGAASYTHLSPELRAYLPIGGWLVLAGRARVGLLHGDVPVTERFFSGGPARHRGFAERQLSPRAPGLLDGRPANLVIGGEAVIETGVELRIPISTLGGFPYGTELFVDGGDVVATPDSLDASNLYWAAGLGLYLSLFGVKVRMGAGELLTRRTNDGFWENIKGYIAVGDAY